MLGDIWKGLIIRCKRHKSFQEKNEKFKLFVNGLYLITKIDNFVRLHKIIRYQGKLPVLAYHEFKFNFDDINTYFMYASTITGHACQGSTKKSTLVIFDIDS